MTTSREHSRRRMKRIKRNAMTASLLCCLAAANSNAADVQENPFLVEHPATAKMPRQDNGIAAMRPRPQRLPAVTVPLTPAAAEPATPALAPAAASPVALAPPPQAGGDLTELPAPSPRETRARELTATTPVAQPAEPSTGGFPRTAIVPPIRTVSTRKVNSRSAMVTWLQSSTPSSERKESIQLLDQAIREYNFHAWASAEATAWESLRRAAEGMDIADRKSRRPDGRSVARAARDLQIARDAIREARDFSGIYGDLNADGVRRVVRSHRTDVLKHERADVPATDAIDRYLNEARMRLSGLATHRVEAAQAMDLIAAIHLGRGEPRTLPSETALCLRRAALQGQPGNGSLALRLGMQLADLGLNQEARWALEHSLKIEPTREATATLANVMQRSGDSASANQLNARLRDRLPANKPQPPVQVPEVLQLSPEEFANLSPSVIQTTANAPVAAANASTAAATGSVPQADDATSAAETDAPSKLLRFKPKFGGVKRLLGPLGRLW